jgi:hypothetical protein
VKYTILVNVQLRPETGSTVFSYNEGLRVEYGANIIHDGTVMGAARIMERFELLAKQIIAEQELKG